MTSRYFSIALLALMPACTTQPASQTPANGTAANEAGAKSVASDAAALHKAATKDAVKAFYEKTGWVGLWSKAAAATLDHALASRAANGLDHVDFGQVDASMTPAQQDVARTSAALAYASALAGGIADPHKLHDVYTLQAPAEDVAARLAEALKSGRVAQFFATLAPQDDDYRRLSKAYLDEKRQADGATTTAIADKGTIHPGDHDPRLEEIADALVADGYLAQGAAPTATSANSTYAGALVDAVKRLQADYGIKADGVIGDTTLKVVNIGPADKARALAVALERRRWLTRTPPATRIDVNTAAATLTYYRDGKLVDQRRVVVGKPGRETPPLQAPLFQLVASPTWTIPKSIPVPAATIRAKHMHRANGYLVQPSGPDNALGLVKFDMKDDQQIYLHDTSDHSLFARAQRDLSHGCVRVQDALGFAAMLAKQQGIEDKWAHAHQSGTQTFVMLPQAIPVRLLYWNAFVGDGGKIVFRTDPYGWNDAVAKQLGFAVGGNAKAQPHDIDIGP